MLVLEKQNNATWWHWNFCKPIEGIINSAVTLHRMAAELKPWGRERKTGNAD